MHVSCPFFFIDTIDKVCFHLLPKPKPLTFDALVGYNVVDNDMFFITE